MAVLIVMCGNLVGLTFVGMEHLLQVMLMAGCAYGLLEMYAGRPIPTLVFWMAAVAPVVRYENLAYTLAIVLACWLQGRRRTAAKVLLGGIVPLLLFGLFLHRHGLPMLPTSVLVKAAAASTRSSSSPASNSVVHSALAAIGANGKRYLVFRNHWSINLSILLIGLALIKARSVAPKRNSLLCTLVAAVLLVLLGPFGWFFRYEVSLRLFVLLIALVAFAHQQAFASRWVYALLALGAYTYVQPLKLTPYAAASIRRQQYQMHRFEEAYYRKPLAVNDLGLVSFDHDPSVYVLDLAGLGSYEVSQQPLKNAAFLTAVTRKHDTGLAMIYDGWFPDKPRDWVRVGVLHQAPMKYPGTVAELNVSFYATRPDSVDEIREDILRFRSTVPSGVSMEVLPK